MPPVKTKDSCLQCGNVFSRRSDLRRHVRTVHEGCRPYQCTWPACSYFASSRSALKAHRNTHAGVKPHKCPCGTAFSDPSALSRHKREVHFEGLLCPMPQCSKTIKRRTEFINHVKRHGIDPYTIPSVVASAGRRRRRVSVDNDLLAFDLATSVETLVYDSQAWDSAPATRCPSPADSFDSACTLVNFDEEPSASVQYKVSQADFDSCQAQAWSDSRSVSPSLPQKMLDQCDGSFYPQDVLYYMGKQNVDYSNLQMKSQSPDGSQELWNQNREQISSAQDFLACMGAEFLNALYLQPQPQPQLQVPASLPYDAYSCPAQALPHSSLCSLGVYTPGLYPDNQTAWGMQTLNYLNASSYLDSY